MKWLWVALLNTVALTPCGHAAAIVYNSLDLSVMSSEVVVSDGPLYASFTNTGIPYVSDLSLRLLRTDPNSTGSIQAFLYGNVEGFNMPADSPAYYLGSLADSSVLPTESVYSISFSYVPLSGYVRYWIGLQSSDGSSIAWVTSSDVTPFKVAGEYVMDKQGTKMVGLSPENGGGYPFEWALSDEPLTAVPEPGAAGLILAGLAVLRARLYRRGLPKTRQ